MVGLPQRPEPEPIDWAVALPAIAARSRGLIPIADVAAYFAVTTQTVRNWIRHGTHPSGRGGNLKLVGDQIGRGWHVHLDDLRAFEAAR
jgi:hypothetical protein